MSDSLRPPWTIACQAPLSTGFPRQGYRSGFLTPSPGDLPHPGIESASPEAPVFLADSLPSEPPGKPVVNKLDVTPACMKLKSLVDIVKKISKMEHQFHEINLLHDIHEKANRVHRSQRCQQGIRKTQHCRVSGSSALKGNCWYKLVSRIWELMKGRKILFWSITSPFTVEAASP